MADTPTRDRIYVGYLRSAKTITLSVGLNHFLKIEMSAENALRVANDILELLAPDVETEKVDG